MLTIVKAYNSKCIQFKETESNCCKDQKKVRERILKTKNSLFGFNVVKARNKEREKRWEKEWEERRKKDPVLLFQKAYERIKGLEAELTDRGLEKFFNDF